VHLAFSAHSWQTGLKLQLQHSPSPLALRLSIDTPALFICVIPLPAQVFTLLVGDLQQDLSSYGGSLVDLLQIIFGSDPAREVSQV
jgi:hypothetical protein